MGSERRAGANSNGVRPCLACTHSTLKRYSMPVQVPWELQELMTPLFCFLECPGNLWAESQSWRVASTVLACCMG